MNGKVIEERSMNYTSYKDYVRIPFLFQGQYYDEEIKLAYNRFRYYDPQMGRYISEDPIGLESGELNLFSYDIWNQNGTLKEVRPPGGGDFAFDALFTYDALGRRLSKDAIGITCWLWNGNVPLHEWTPSQRRNEQGEIEEIYKSYQDNKPVNIKKCLNHQ